MFNDGHGIAWPLDGTEWALRACRDVGRKLTAAE
jgi:hypothetical protein